MKSANSWLYKHKSSLIKSSTLCLKPFFFKLVSTKVIVFLKSSSVKNFKTVKSANSWLYKHKSSMIKSSTLNGESVGRTRCRQRISCHKTGQTSCSVGPFERLVRTYGSLCKKKYYLNVSHRGRFIECDV